MRKGKISFDEVLKIRGSGNPNKAIAPKTHIQDLNGKTYEELVEIFKSRITERYINAAEFIDKNNDFNFVLFVTCCVILDLLSQYIYGKPSSSEKIFKKFFRKYLKKHNHPIKPPIISCYYNNKEEKWYEESINDAADGFYHCFRCGVVHSGMILEYGRINRTNPEDVIKISEWGKGREIVVNPSKLLEEIKKIFDNYINDLKKKNPAVKTNFIKRLIFDYGIEFMNDRAWLMRVDPKKFRGHTT